MLWLVNDFDLLTVLFHAAALAFEALVLGGVLFLLFVLHAGESKARSRTVRGLLLTAIALTVAEAASITINGSLLRWNAGLTIGAILSAPSMLAQEAAALCAVVIATAAGVGKAGQKWLRTMTLALVVSAIGLLNAAVLLSHAASRLDHRAPLILLTAIHHLGTAAWVGAMPFLLLSLRDVSSVDEARVLARRYSVMAFSGALSLIGAGVGMSWFYVSSFDALYGTSYGILLLVKCYLLALMLVLGAGNWYIVRRLQVAPQPLLIRLRRFGEAEIGIGFTIILAAASMSSQPPAVDMLQSRTTGAELAARFHAQVPRMHSPPLEALTPPSSMRSAVERYRYGFATTSDTNDVAWSEYNHHWAGLVVFCAGGLALLSRFRRLRWAKYWPVSFAALAAFVVLRADAEAWPLGPRSFWQSFAAPDVLEHRVAALLILGFAVFECGVQVGKLRTAWPKFIFPAVCICGAALLLTHNHVLSNPKEEVLAEISHSGIALLGATAGWARWLEIRFHEQGRVARVAHIVWPCALMLAGAVLLDYREA